MSERNNVDLHAALAKVSSSNAAERKEGLADIEHIFRHNQNNQTVNSIKDKTWHSIYEAIFQCAGMERAVYLRSTQSQKSKADARLQACGKALRTTITAGVRKIRMKTVKAVLDHVRQTLPTPEGPYCPGLSMDYVKSLRVLFEYQPHVEHLRDAWQDALDFCVNGIARIDDEFHEDDDEIPHTMSGASILRTSTISLSKRSRAATPQVYRAHNRRALSFRKEADDLVVCIYQLVRATNARVELSDNGNSAKVVNTLTTFLKFSGTVRQSHNEAFAAINALLSRSTMSSLSLTQSIMVELYPLVKDLWSSKSAHLRDEMLITLILTRDHVSSLVEKDEQANFRLDVENLLEALQLDYGKRLERDQLQLGDLLLEFTSPNRLASLQLPAFGLRRGHIRAESHWSTIYLTSLYSCVLDARTSRFHQVSQRQGAEQDYKRARLSLTYQDMLRCAAISSPPSQTASLQSLAFLSQITKFTGEELQDILPVLSNCMSDTNSSVSSWAMIASTSFAIQEQAQSRSFQEYWSNVFNLVARNLASPACSRAASYLLNALLALKLVGYASVASIIENIFSSIELHGPAILSDASLALLGTLVQIRSSDNPSSAGAMAESLSRWIFNKWTPSAFYDKAYASQLSSSCRPWDIIHVLLQCRNQVPKRSTGPRFVSTGQVGRAWRRTDTAKGLTDFLLLKTHHTFLIVPPGVEIDNDETLVTKSARSPLGVSAQILDACDAETERTLIKWNEWTAEKPQSLLPEMVAVVASLCVVNSFVLSPSDDRLKKKFDTLRRKEELLLKTLADFIGRPDCEQDKLDAALNVLADHLPHVRDVETANNPVDSLVSLSVHLASAFRRRYRARSAAADANETLDDIDIDGFESQASEMAIDYQADSGPRDLFAVTTSSSSFRQSLATYVEFLSSILRSSVELGDVNDPIPNIPSAFVSYLIELAPHELCACRPILLDILSIGLPFRSGDAEKLFDHLAEFFRRDEYSRHEVALLLNLDMLRGCATQWTTEDHIGLADSGFSAYEWFLLTALPNNICSIDVKIAIADLLFSLLELRGPEYKPDAALDSVRSALFKLLRASEVPVKYHIAQYLPLLFNHITLGEHENAFKDLHENLLFDEAWIESQAVRNLLLAKLGSRWSTLLRRSIYHIFETAGFVTQSAGYATRCITTIRNSLKLADSQALFRIFAGQLLFTWLTYDTETIETIPFGIFGYKSLRDLLSDIEDEATAQIMMRTKSKGGKRRGHDKDVNVLVTFSEKIGIGKADLAERNFARAAAYCIANDVSKETQRIVRDKRKKTKAEESEEDFEPSEKTLSALASPKYNICCELHFPKILGILFLRADLEPDYEKKGSEIPCMETYLARRSSNVKANGGDGKFEDSASKALLAMKAINSSNTHLPAPQQPSFKGKLFMDISDRVTRRFKSELRGQLARVFTPAVYVYVLRLLLSNLEEALGSLHACVIVRKIRVLIALSGQSALNGYPLEMTLHSLRPLLVDKVCADDTLGIVQYLYINAMDYLRDQISFVTGMTLTTLISLRKFVESSQESTTQESRHVATMTKASAFRAWLVESWSKKYVESNVGSRYAESYLQIIQSAHRVSATANPSTGTPESRVLVQLLDARKSYKGLLHGPTWNLAMSLLCSEFEAPASYRTDILGLESQAAKYASDVWASCKDSTLNSQYLLWAARVLGRANNAPAFDVATLHEGKSGDIDHINPHAEVEETWKTILNVVVGLLSSGDLVHAGLAEETIRSALNRLTDDARLTEALEHLPTAVGHAMSLGTPDFAIAICVPKTQSLEACFSSEHHARYDHWLRQLTLSLIDSCSDEPLIGSLARIVTGVSELAESLFPPILHLVLEQDGKGTKAIKQTLSNVYRRWLSAPPPSTAAHVKALLHSVLYLRKQPYPHETTHADRLQWLEIDFAVAAEAAERSGLHTTALLFAELSYSQPTKSSRRSSIATHIGISDELLLSIFRNIDDPDSFYGVQQAPSLDLVLDRLDHEDDGFKGLLFRGARLDSQLRRLHETSPSDNGGLIRALVDLNMNSLTYNLLASQTTASNGKGMVDSILQTATRLEQWDVRAPENSKSETVTLYKVFQSINNSNDVAAIRSILDAQFLSTLDNMLIPSRTDRGLKASFRTLGILAEIDDVVTATSPDHLMDAWKNIKAREAGLFSVSSDTVKSILSSREILLSTLCTNASMRETMHIGLSELRRLHVDALLSSCRVWNKRQGSQQSLATATYLSDIVPICAEVGINIDTAAQNAVADVLWAQQETSTSIRLLRRIVESPRTMEETTEVHRSSLLAKLGHHVAQARMEQPDQIMDAYLVPAIKELKGMTTGSVAGHVFHQFAAFCDNQLRNADATQDFDRAQKIRNRRKGEIETMLADIKATKSQTAIKQKKYEMSKAQKWYKLDSSEYERLRKIRESFMTASLENYLLSLSASNEYDNNALRFFAVWLEYADSELANDAVEKYLSRVPSAKLARLMNQLSSRLQDEKTKFQRLLGDLVFQICCEHPYHGMHHITASTHRPGTDDGATVSRHRAANAVALRLQHDKHAGGYWHRILRSDRLYHDLARFTDESVAKAGREIRLDQLSVSKLVVEKIPTLSTPPPTLTIAIRINNDYSNVPKVTGFRSKMRVAGGISAPKIITSICSDGTSFKQLFKGGGDDLRQDAIMEQVFVEVSKLLGNHTTTRQRKLRIRTYNVLPLSNRSGIIEFAQNTIALQDALIPLHEKYFPKDWRSSSKCRNVISDATKHSVDHRINAYKEVCKYFNPAMRFFFFERFQDPDEWFERRLAYTRSTAAISILGHIVGLGDRHLHNILLDQQSGEVVHIDLGVCFEAGRILPIAEVVPFRLTRDLVDGMGYTKTEGVFRRCCEFTLDALREELESIMTILNVLRYDPLYSWTVSRTKAKRLQEADEAQERMIDDKGEQASKRNGDEEGEAGRALAVVEKKLGKTLSAAATVSELIAQATDERNLALLFCGWSAWV